MDEHGMQTRLYGPRKASTVLGTATSAIILAAVVGAAPVVLPSLPAFALQGPASFADLIEQVGPAVVQITAKERSTEQESAAGPLSQLPPQFREGPFRDFFERFFREGVPTPMPTPRADRAALGSGFVISQDGIVVTNNHVIGDAQKIEVTLKDGSSYPARLLGKDDKTDLAVLKINPDRPLPVLAWGDSDKMRVGDWVVAVGNPFGLSGTATAGIISSRGRDIGSGPYDDFIQIDAPLNSGNSGGPLFSSDGQVVGVNTAIFSPNGGSIGIGFAIPSNAAEKIVAELQEHGSVQRGWLGVAIQPVTPEVAESLGLKKTEGALVATVTEDSPAAKAGLRQGDVVLTYDGKPVTTPRDLSRAVADTRADTKARLTVWRDTRDIEVHVKVGQMPEQVASRDDRPEAAVSVPQRGRVQLSALGLTLAPLDGNTRSHQGLPKGVRGALIASVDDKADAANKGLMPGDIITRVNQDNVSDPSDVVHAVEKAQSSHRKSVLLLVERKGDQHFVAVDLSTA